jgi:hypothetical protein
VLRQTRLGRVLGMSFRDDAGPGREPYACVYCGATEDLVPDQDIEDLHYCRTCLEKHLRHDRQIEERGEAEPPFDG